MTQQKAIAYADLKAFFAPESVAVIGASAEVAKFGGRVLHYLLHGGFAGRVHAINARHPQVQGVRTFPDVGAIPGSLDLAVIAVPAEACETAVRDCAAHGVKAAIVFTSGFAESGAAGRARQEELLAVARAAGLRLLGPNCIGLTNERLRMAATFATMWKEGWPEPGPVSIVCQSGALASYFYVMLRERGVGIARWCSTGNEIDVDVAECVHYLATDPDTRVIVVAIEGLSDGRRLLAALEVAKRRRVPVIVLKLGRSAVGSAAAMSHTGALAGDDRVFDAAVGQSGALRCREFGEAVDLAVACTLGRYPAGRRLAIVSASGGGGILAADRAEECALEVPELDAVVRQRLDAMLPGGASRNPVDVTAMVLSDTGLMVRPVAEVAKADVDGVVVFLTSAFRADASVDALRAALRHAGLAAVDKPILLSGICSAEARRGLLADGFPIYTEPAGAVEVFAALARLRERWAEAASPEPAVAEPLALASGHDESTLLAFLAQHGVPSVPTWRVASCDEALAAARAIGGAAVLKLAVSGLHHKSEAGGVALGLKTADDVRQAYARLQDNARAAGLARRLLGVIVQRQVGGVIEMLLGMRRDPAFGPVVTLGLGGKWVELVDDVAIRLAPVDAAEAGRMLASLRGARLLRGLRDQPAADVDALIEAVVAFSRLAARLEGIASLEVNPFVLGAPGEGGFAVDAKALPAR